MILRFGGLQRPPICYHWISSHHRTMSDILLEIQDAPGEIYDIDWESGTREFIQEHPVMDWDDVADWVEQTHGIQVTPAMEERIQAIQEEEYEPTDDEMMGSFGTPWHDGL